MLYQDVGTHASSDFSKEQVDTQKKQQQFQNEQTLSQCSPFRRAQRASKGTNLATKLLVPTKSPPRPDSLVEQHHGF